MVKEKNADEPVVIKDWTLDSVNRGKEGDISTYVAVFSSEEAKKHIWEPESNIFVDIYPYPSLDETLHYEYTAEGTKKNWYDYLKVWEGHKNEWYAESASLHIIKYAVIIGAGKGIEQTTAPFAARTIRKKGAPLAWKFTRQSSTFGSPTRRTKPWRATAWATSAG